MKFLQNIVYKNILFATFILLLTSCGKKEAAQKAVETPEKTEKELILDDAQLKMMHIEIGSAAQKNIGNTLIVNGKVTVLAKNMADISAQVRGRVERILAHEGDYVQKGQTVAEIVSPEIVEWQRTYLLAKSELFFLEKEQERQKTLQQAQVGASKTLEEVQSKLMAQQAILKTVALNLEIAGIAPPQYADDIRSKIAVKSPISGYIEHFTVAIGSAVTEGTKIVQLKNFEDPHADLFVYERDLQHIHEGQTVRIRFADPNMPEVTGKIEHVGRDIDPNTRTAMAHVAFKAANNQKLATDMQVTAYIESTNVQQEALPESAVVEDEGAFFCFLAEKLADGKTQFVKTKIEKTGSSNGFIGVRNIDLKNKNIVTRGAIVLLSSTRL